jgi:hypothetical protein
LAGHFGETKGGSVACGGGASEWLRGGGHSGRAARERIRKTDVEGDGLD